MRLDFSRANWLEVEARIASGCLAVLAVGACEQHGAHLPLTTDTDMAFGQAGQIADQVEALLLPPITYGDAWNNEAYPGTISLSPATLRAMIEDIGRGLKRMGVPGLIVVNGHFGNREPISLAARTLLAEGLPVLQLDYPGLDQLAVRINETKAAGMGFMHADEFETSVMLSVAPDAVRMALAAEQYPEFPKNFGSEPMQLRDFNPTGVFGDPRPATAEKGAAFLSGVTENALPLIEDWRNRHGI